MKRVVTKTSELGNFLVTCGAVRVTDPGQPKKSKRAVTIDNLLDGTWRAQTLYGHDGDPDWGERVVELRVFHHEFCHKEYTWKLLKIGVDVDSGQVGIFNLIDYPDKQTRAEKNKEGSFYSRCGKQTMRITLGGIIREGVVSLTSYEGGVYDCFTAIKEGKVIGIKIVCIPEEIKETI